MKYLKTICLITVLLLLLTGCGVGGHKNTTGSTRYSDSEVSLNCVNVTENEKSTVTTYIDILFNTKSGYQMESYTKISAKYKSTLTDEDYKKALDSLNSIKCINEDCSASHLELGITALGFDTVVDRGQDTLVMTGYNLVGSGYEATQSDVDLAKSSYESEGFTCS